MRLPGYLPTVPIKVRNVFLDTFTNFRELKFIQYLNIRKIDTSNGRKPSLFTYCY